MKPRHASRISAFLSAWRRFSGRERSLLARASGIPVMASNVETLPGPAEFGQVLLDRINRARRRIFISALYLENDEAGREILDAIYAARQARPEIEVAIFVDWHRAQRGLIGKAHSKGNIALYKARAQASSVQAPIYGVPVQKSEWMGVLHLKGMVIDDEVFYSGASLNNVYLHRKENYRLDRYHRIGSPALADCLARLMGEVFRANPAVYPLDTARTPTTLELREHISRFRRLLGVTRYRFNREGLKPGHVYVTPLLGIGARRNELNAAILRLVRQTQRRLLLFTPYFNLPGTLRREVGKKLESGCQVTVVVGDKTANDFYLPPDQPFKAIGVIPYFYEINLRRFCQAHQKAIDSGQLNVLLWKSGANTYHVKGMISDEKEMLLTGHNLNPRAWRLDLENALLIQDPQELLAAQNRAEFERIAAHAKRIARFDEIETLDAYPTAVQRLIRRLTRIRIDRLLNQIL